MKILRFFLNFENLLEFFGNFVEGSWRPSPSKKSMKITENLPFLKFFINFERIFLFLEAI